MKGETEEGRCGGVKEEEEEAGQRGRGGGPFKVENRGVVISGRRQRHVSFCKLKSSRK